ncbi:HAD family hydrolase [Halodesulfurarchaeum sp.]|uniref:HAD family hydrolase n=1 Tax=Halodesulfurarchaeum sp. TaxID=1980530 RepID=UPI001BBB3846|nr:HAD-IA family hydrolase [Halodesulfurarchaeum sp.]
MSRAVVFDMDGVIVDTEQYWVEAERDILDTALPAGHGVDPHEITGINVHEQYEILEANHELQVSQEEYFDLFDSEAEGVYEQADLLTGFHDLLDRLEDRAVPIGLATSSYPRWIDIVFETHDLGDRFEHVLSAANLDGPGKPEPLIYETIAERLGVSGEELLVVEDSENGIAAAAAAGAYTIAYAPHGTADDTDRSPADEVLGSSEELRESMLQPFE